MCVRECVCGISADAYHAMSDIESYVLFLLSDNTPLGPPGKKKGGLAITVTVYGKTKLPEIANSYHA